MLPLKTTVYFFFNVDFREKEYEDQNKSRDYSYFEVIASAPLQIYLPKLGYMLEYDLVKFVQYYNEELNINTIKNLGYSYFKEIEPESNKKARQIQRNRENAYYNSSMHFVRSLYSNSLKENGYEVLEILQDGSRFSFSEETFDFSSCTCLTYIQDEAKLTGLEGSRFRINYYLGVRKPYDLNKPYAPKYPNGITDILLVKDTCTLRKNGSLPGGEIIFDGDMVTKRMGAALPFDIEF